MAVLKAHQMLAAKEEYNELKSLRSQLEAADQDDQKNIILAELYIKIGNYVKAEQLISDLFQKNPADSRVLAFKGVLVAEQAISGQNKFQTHLLIKKAYMYLDKSVHLATNVADKFHGFLTRGMVSKKLQENFGHKSVRGAEDLIAAASIAEMNPDLGHPGVILAEAAESYELIGMKNQSREILFKVLSMKDLPSKVLCKILERGIITE